MSRFNYVIVGAVAAGCVLANRLTADPAITVLLVEAGPDNAPGREHSSIRDPYPVSLAHPGLSWPQLAAEVGAELETDEPRLSRHYLQGLGVGGGSNIQGMVALRGLPQDYDEWRDLGATGWGWDEVLPYFRRVESDLDFEGPLHGRAGLIPIRRIHPADWAPFEWRPVSGVNPSDRNQSCATVQRPLKIEVALDAAKIRQHFVPAPTRRP